MNVTFSAKHARVRVAPDLPNVMAARRTAALNQNTQSISSLGRCNVRLNDDCARTYVAALLIALSLGGAPAAASSAASGASSTANAGDISNIRIDNFGRVDPMYYRG